MYSTRPPALAICTCRSAQAPVSHTELSHANTSCFLVHPPLPARCQHILSPQILLILDHHLYDVSFFPASCFSHCSSCGLSNSSLPRASVCMLSRGAPCVCPEAPVSWVSSVHLHWVHFQQLDYGLCVKMFLLSDMPVLELITYFMYFKMLVCTRMDIKFRVEFYLWISDGLKIRHS